MTFHVGQKVICLRDGWSFWPNYGRADYPIAGDEYVVRGINIDAAGCVGLWLVGVSNRRVRLLPDDILVEPAFALETDGIPNFRPIVERETDISIFTAMLGPKEKVSA